MSPATVLLRTAIVAVLTDYARRDPGVYYARKGVSLDVLNRGVRVRESVLTNALSTLVREGVLQRKTGAHGQSFYRLASVQPQLSLATRDELLDALAKLSCAYAVLSRGDALAEPSYAHALRLLGRDLAGQVSR